jgi:tetratricopeptide (TPR) repeat protein
MRKVLSFSQRLNRLNKAERLGEAAQLLQRELEKRPGDLWLRERLAMNYYERRQYKRALNMVNNLIATFGETPLLIWDRACALDMLDHEETAISLWKKLMRKSGARIAKQEGESLSWAAYIINDCRYRIGVSYLRLGRKSLARNYLSSHLAHRRRGLWTDYSRRRVLGHLKDANSRTKLKTA